MSVPKYINCFIIAGLALMFPSGGTTQPDLHFEHLTIEDGLANNEVRHIFQDSKGFMWFGTHSGLNRYDGHEMRTYLPDRDNPESISLVVIQSIIEDKQGRLWMAGFGISGINRYDPEKDEFRTYLLPDSLQSLAQQIFEDRRGNLWVSTWDYGILRFNKERETFEPFPVALPKGAEKERVTVILEDSFGHLWFNASNGMYRFSWRDSSFHFYPLPGGVKGSKDEFIIAVFEDSQKNLWVGTAKNGLFAFQRELGRFVQVLDDPATCQCGVLTINEDTNGWLWIGSEGLVFLDPRTQQPYPYKSPSEEPETPEGSQIWHIYRDRQGDMWVGTYSSGIYYYSGTRKKFGSIRFPSEEDGKSLALSIYERANGQIWVSAYWKIVLFDPVQDQFLTQSIPIPAWTLFEDDKGSVWAGTWRLGIGRFHPGQKQIFYYHPDPAQPGSLPEWAAPDVFQDRQGTIWVKVEGVGIYRYIPGDETFEAYPLVHSQTGKPIGMLIKAFYEGQDGSLWLGGGAGLVRIHPGRNGYTHYSPDILPFKIITTITEDSEGTLWLGSTDGLARFDPKHQKMQLWTQKDGLANNFVVGILEDNQGGLWISTVKGLSRFNPQTRRFRNYDTADGLPSNQFNQRSYLKTKNGELFFGAINGILRFHPDSIRDNRHVPLVYITNIKINNRAVPIAGTSGDTLGFPSPLHQQIPYAKALSLAHWQKDLSFTFAALNYFHPEKNQYKYRLENYDADWITTDASRPYATYTNIHPGNYTFRVIASNNDGLWNEEGASLLITITPPWWLTYWAYGLYLLVALAGLYAVYNFQLNRQLARAETLRLRELDQAKTRLYTNISHEFRTPLTIILGLAGQLKAQVNEGAKSGLNMIERNGQRLLLLVNRMLDLRKLEAGKMPVKYIQSDVIQYLKYMLEAFHILAGEKNIRLHFLTDTENLNMDFDPDKLADILSNLISNAIKFSPEGSDVFLQVRQEDGQLRIKIKDKGIGISPQQLPHVFGRFYQADDSSTHRGQGTGIGLALAKEMVKLLEGEISVKSTLGQGSEFTVSLPIRNQEAAQATTLSGQPFILAPAAVESIAETSLEENGQKTLVLIVEDDPDVTHYLASCLKQDYRLICAADGKTGIDKALDEIPDLIISDVMMPEMDGFELCNILKKDERTSHIPIILLTARADTASKLQGLRSGADAYLSKPFNPEELKVRLHQLFELRQRLRQRYGGNAFGKNIPPPHKEEDAFQKEDAFLKKVRAVIEKKLSDPEFDVQQLSRELGLSRSQLFRKVKGLTGKSIILYIRSVRLHQAREMLQSTDMNISEVGYAVGFTNPAYFSTAFLNEFGENPSSIRHS